MATMYTAGINSVGHKSHWLPFSGYITYIYLHSLTKYHPRKCDVWSKNGALFNLLTSNDSMAVHCTSHSTANRCPGSTWLHARPSLSSRNWEILNQYTSAWSPVERQLEISWTRTGVPCAPFGWLRDTRQQRKWSNQLLEDWRRCKNFNVLCVKFKSHNRNMHETDNYQVTRCATTL
jgi:hypothetical protein